MLRFAYLSGRDSKLKVGGAEYHSVVTIIMHVIAKEEGQPPSCCCCAYTFATQSNKFTIVFNYRWHLGNEVTPEAVIAILNASTSTNCFGVYKSSDQKYMFSSK